MVLNVILVDVILVDVAFNENYVQLMNVGSMYQSSTYVRYLFTGYHVGLKKYRWRARMAKSKKSSEMAKSKNGMKMAKTTK